MKPILTALVLCTCLSLFSQNREADSLFKALRKEKVDTLKVDILYKLSHYYQNYKPDSALVFAQEAYFLSVKHDYLSGESWSLNQMAIAFSTLGNFPKALEYYLEQLRIEEKIGKPANIAIVYMDIALLYTGTKDYTNSILYSLKADSITRKHNLTDYIPYALLNLGDAYEKSDLLDSALLYTNQCYVLSQKAQNKVLIGTALNNLGNIYLKKGDLKEAYNNYRTGIPFVEEGNDNRTYAETLLGIARVFEKQSVMDSAVIYARKSFDLSLRNQFPDKMMMASIFLKDLFKQKGRTDSAFIYQETVMMLKDSLENQKKLQEVQSLTLQEQLRQQEIARQKLQEAKDRETQLQLLLIGIMIPAFFLISVVLSRRKVHRKVIELAGIISVLLFFEYITLMLHPFVKEMTHHNAFYEIIIFVCIAAIITPAHHRFQQWLIARLTRMNYVVHHRKERIPVNENEGKTEIL